MDEAKSNFCKNYQSYISLKKNKKYSAISFHINEHFDKQKMGNTYTNYEIQNVSTPQQLLDESRKAIRQLGDTITTIDETYKSESEELKEYNRANKIALDNCNQVPNFATSQTLLSSAQLEKYIVAQDKIPKSVDIREWGLINSIQNQGSCGSCWAFTTRNVVDSLILHDIKYWREIYNESEMVQKWTTKTFRSSVQFVLNNSYGNNYMCGGGNFINAGVDVAYGYVPGIELNSVAGYTSFSSVDEKPEKDPKRIPLQTQEFIDYQLIPVHYYDSQSDCPAVLFTVSADNKQAGFGVEDNKVQLIKRILATGMALSGRMHTEGSNNQDDTQAFQMYSKGVLREAKCETQTSNHQITLIGYGHYQDESVWVFANSWGTSWGQQGSFYVKIGSNYLCTELDVYGMMPRFRGYNQTLEDTSVPFNQTEVYKEMKESSVLLNLNENQIVRGINGLDDYDEDGNPVHYQKKLTIGFYIICLILLIFLGIWISFALRCMCCPLKKTIKEPQYLQTSKHDLDNANFASQFNLTVTL